MLTDSARRTTPLGAALLAVSGLATAQDAALGDNYQLAQQSLDAVTVEGRELPEYLPKAAPSVSGPMPLALREVPQSVSIMTEERMRDEGLVSASDVLARTTGISFSYHNSQERTYASARGYRLDNVLIDGLSLQGNQRRLSADLALYEQVEVLRGPNGLFAGSGTSGNPSGSINLVRKKPTKTPRASVLLSGGSWNNYRATVDAGGALNANGSIRARGVVSYVDREYFYDFAYRKNLTAGGSVEVDLGASTLLTFGVDYETRDARLTWPRYFRSWDGTDPGGRRNSSTGMPWGNTESNEYGAFVQLEHHFANDWKLNAHYTRKKSDEHSDYASVMYYVDSRTGEYHNFIQSSYGDSKNWDEGLALNLNGTFALFGRTHEFVTGFNFQSNKRHALYIPANWRGYAYERYGAPARLEIVDFPTMDYSLYPYLPSSMDYSRWNVEEPDRQNGYYASARFHIADPLKVLTGLRVSRFSEGGISKDYTKPPQYKSGAYVTRGTVTPFAAISYDVNAQHTLHASYTEVFAIQDYYDLDGNRVAPLKGKNRELGLKSEWYDGRLQSMLTLYRLDRTNGTWRVEESPCQSLLQLRGITAACYVADNKQRTTGVEMEINGALAPNWDIAVGASAMRRKYVKQTSDGGRTSALEGQSWSNTEPTRTMNIWLLHRLQGAARGWRAGLGLRAQNRVWYDYGGSTTRDAAGNVLSRRPPFTYHQGGYGVLNAMLSWDISPQWRAQLNVDNISSRNYQTQFGSWYVSNSAPRSYLLTLAGRF